MIHHGHHILHKLPQLPGKRRRKTGHAEKAVMTFQCIKQNISFIDHKIIRRKHIIIHFCYTGRKIRKDAFQIICIYISFSKSCREQYFIIQPDNHFRFTVYFSEEDIRQICKCIALYHFNLHRVFSVNTTDLKKATPHARLLQYHHKAATS